MIKQIKIHAIKSITGGYTICKCLGKDPFALMSDEENACKTISWDCYTLSNSKKNSCSDFNIEINFNSDKKEPCPNFNTQIDTDISWF